MAANDNAQICAADFTLQELLAAAIGQDATGKNYLRLYTATGVAGSKAVICGAFSDTEDLLKSVFTLNAAGDIAIRTSTT